MSERPARLQETAAELRRSFDESFAVPRLDEPKGARTFIALRAGAGRYAVEVKELKGLEAHRRIVALPAGDPAVLGIAGVRGQLVPVYALSLLLGEGKGAEQPSWLAICGDAEPVALAFDEVEGQIRVQASDLCALDSGAMRKELREAFTWEGVTRYVLDVSAIIGSIERRMGAAEPRGSDC